jgi:hypothetical protein
MKESFNGSHKKLIYEQDFFLKIKKSMLILMKWETKDQRTHLFEVKQHNDLVSHVFSWLICYYCYNKIMRPLQHLVCKAKLSMPTISLSQNNSSYDLILPQINRLIIIHHLKGPSVRPHMVRLSKLWLLLQIF